MIKSRTLLSAAAIGFTALGGMSFNAGFAQAQSMTPAGTPSNTEGMVVGVHVSGASLAVNGGKSETGGGGGVLIGYGFNRQFMLYVGFDVAKVQASIVAEDQTSSYTLSHVDLGLRYSFANPDRRLVPYVNAAITGRSASATISGTNISTSGPAFTGGGGIQYFVNSKVALDANLQYTTGKFSKVKVGGTSSDISNAGNSNSARINLGVRFYPNLGTSLQK